MTSSGSRTGGTEHGLKATIHQDNHAKWTAVPPGTSGRRLDSGSVSAQGVLCPRACGPDCTACPPTWPRLCCVSPHVAQAALSVPPCGPGCPACPCLCGPGPCLPQHQAKLSWKCKGCRDMGLFPVLIWGARWKGQVVFPILFQRLKKTPRRSQLCLC